MKQGIRIALSGGLCLVLWQTCFAIAAHAERERPIIVNLPGGDATAEAVQFWNAGLGKPFDMLAFEPGSAVPEMEAGAGLGWWSPSTNALIDGLESKPAALRWLVFDMSEPERVPADERESLEQTSQMLGEAGSKSGVKTAVILDHDIAMSLATRFAPYYDLLLLELPQPDPAAAEEVRQFAIAVNKANGRARIGCYFAPQSALGYDKDAFVAFYSATHEFIHYYGLRWPEDSETFGRFVSAVNREAPSAPASQGMYANTMQAPEQPLDPAVARPLRIALAVSSVLFVAAFAAFLYFYKGPQKPKRTP